MEEQEKQNLQFGKQKKKHVSQWSTTQYREKLNTKFKFNFKNYIIQLHLTIYYQCIKFAHAICQLHFSTVINHHIFYIPEVFLGTLLFIYTDTNTSTTIVLKIEQITSKLKGISV